MNDAWFGPRCRRCNEPLTKDHVVGRPRSSWCSWACKRPRVAPRACARCETVFTPRNGAARFCEKACQQAAAAKGTGTDEDVVRFARALVAAQRDQAVG